MHRDTPHTVSEGGVESVGGGLLDAPSPALRVSLMVVHGQREETLPMDFGKILSSRKQRPTGGRGR